MEDTERERFLSAVREGLADGEAERVVDNEELGTFLNEQLGPLDPERIYRILEERFKSGEKDLAAQHN